MMGSDQHHWELIQKMEPIDDANELSYMPKMDLDFADLGVGGTVGIAAGTVTSIIGGTHDVSAAVGVPDVSMIVKDHDAMFGGTGSFYDAHTSPDQKPQIRHDCMWAGVCDDQSHPEKNATGCGSCARQQLIQQQKHQQQQQQQPPLALRMPVKSAGASDIPKPLPGDVTNGVADGAKGPSAGGSVLVNRFPTPLAGAGLKPAGSTTATTLLTPFKATQSSAQIPAGSSLLIKRQQQQQKQQQQLQQTQSTATAMFSQGYRQLPPTPPSSDGSSTSSEGGDAVVAGVAGEQQHRIVRVPHVTRGSFMSMREHEARSIGMQNHARPDTPLSLEDDPLEFKHNLDLVATCTMGSNQQSLLQPSIGGTGGSGTSSSNSGSNSTTSGTGVESRSLGGCSVGGARFGVNCTCGGTSSWGHTTQCYFNYLQDNSTSPEELRIKQLREQLLMIDDPELLMACDGGGQYHHHYHHHHHHHHQRYGGLHHLPDSCESQLAQLLIDLREIEGGSDSRSCLLEDNNSSLAAASRSLQQQQQLHPQQHPQQHAPPCGGESSGGAHATCSKECCWSSLELSHHLSSSLVGDRKLRHHHLQQQHRLSRGGTVRGWMSDDDEEDEEDDVVKQLEQEDDFAVKSLELDTSAVYTNSSSWEDDEEEDDDDDREDEEDDDEDDDNDDDDDDDDDGEEDEEEDEDEDDEEEDDRAAMVGGRSRQYSQRRTVARASSYRPYDLAAYKEAKKQKKSSTRTSNGSLKPFAPKMSSGAGSAGCGMATSGSGQSPLGGGQGASYQATHFGDHSYTRPKGGYNMNELGVQTPSDSDEEIDVVSLGDKNLPTNPTARDYRHLQSEVASKIRTASSRASANGQLHYGGNGSGSGGSNHHHSHGHHHQQHFPAGAQQGHHHLSGIYPTPAGSTTISGANTPLPTGSGCASAASSPPPNGCGSFTNSPSGGSSPSGSSRKRSANGKRSGAGSSKRMRHGHVKRSANGGHGSGSSDPAAQALADELDTVEKRNLHNNLERQRRIGLKNLFEELKRQIPHLRDKDRAPKVNILREAASLCKRLNHEADQVNELRQRQMKLYERIRFLRTSMQSQRLAGID